MDATMLLAAALRALYEQQVSNDALRARIAELEAPNLKQSAGVAVANGGYQREQVPMT